MRGHVVWAVVTVFLLMSHQLHASLKKLASNRFRSRHGFGGSNKSPTYRRAGIHKNKHQSNMWQKSHSHNLHQPHKKQTLVLSCADLGSGVDYAAPKPGFVLVLPLRLFGTLFYRALIELCEKLRNGPCTNNSNLFMNSRAIAMHESIGASPASVLLGREPNHPLLSVWDVDPLLDAPNDPSYSDRCSTAFQNLKRSQKRIAEIYNRGRVSVNIVVGDPEFPSELPAFDKISAKLSPRWSGPWSVESFLTPVSERIKKQTDPTETRRAHVSHLKLMPAQ
uniref:Uncharacterized protein n=1 Tax=Timema cristinae TaxID=61476 RepID=A0A7R9D1V8_TIMCR|nr:unnamed protein product [Timema cristinae]